MGEDAPALLDAAEPPSPDACESPGELADDPPAEADPELEDDPPAEADPELEDDPPAETDPELEDDPPAETDPELEDDPPADADPELEDDPPADADPELADDPPTEADPELEDDPPAGAVPLPPVVPEDELVPVTKVGAPEDGAGEADDAGGPETETAVTGADAFELRRGVASRQPTCRPGNRIQPAASADDAATIRTTAAVAIERQKTPCGRAPKRTMHAPLPNLVPLSQPFARGD